MPIFLMNHIKSQIAAGLIVFTVLAGCSTGTSIPPQSKFGRRHPAYFEFQRMAESHAARQEVERLIVEKGGRPVIVSGMNQLLRIPMGAAPSKRGLMLLRAYPRATYAQLNDNIHVLAFFNFQGQLQACDFF